MPVTVNIPESVIQHFPTQERDSLRSLTELISQAVDTSLSALTLDDLADVSAGAPTNGQVLTFDSGDDRWEAQDAGGGSTFAPVVTDATASRNAILSDAGSYVRFTNSSAVTYTIMIQSTVAWPDDAQIEIEQAGTGAVTITPDSGVNIRVNANLTTTLNGQYAVAGLKRVAENEWVLFGNLVAA